MKLTEAIRAAAEVPMQMKTITILSMVAAALSIIAIVVALAARVGSNAN